MWLRYKMTFSRKEEKVLNTLGHHPVITCPAPHLPSELETTFNWFFVFPELLDAESQCKCSVFFGGNF